MKGGTFCYQDMDCGALQDCTSEMKEEARREGLDAFKTYLDNSPNITDVHDYEACGRARNYFGFDATFTYDQAICEDVSQLRYTKNFEFLQEFFNQGSEDGELDDEPKTVEKFELVPINRGTVHPRFDSILLTQF